jgi:hypothetical protein
VRLRAGTAVAVSTAVMGVPHSPQKRWPESCGAPQLGQPAAIEAPQFVQKLRPSRFDAPQLVQSLTSGA